MTKVRLRETEVSWSVLLNALSDFVVRVPVGEIVFYDTVRLRNSADVLEMRLNEEKQRSSRDNPKPQNG